MSTIEEKVRAQARAFDNLRGFENRHLVGPKELKYLLEFENKMSTQTPVDYWSVETPPKFWLAAANLCANDLGCFVPSEDGKIHFIVICNDIFYPAADTETISVNEVTKVNEAFLAENWRGVMKWIAKKRGIKNDEVWFCDKK